MHPDRPSWHADPQACSLLSPCMMCSHPPLLVTTPVASAASRMLPTWLMPVPNMRSNSAVLKGGATLFLATFTFTRMPGASPVASVLMVSFLRTSSLTLA